MKRERDNVPPPHAVASAQGTDVSALNHTPTTIPLQGVEDQALTTQSTAVCD